MKPNSIAFSLVLAGGLIAVSLAIVALKTNGIIDDETSTRAFGVALGLMLAIYGNSIPKQISGDAGLMRFTGWTFVIAYLIYAAIWAFAPMEYTLVGSLAVGAVSLVLMFGYTALTVSRRTKNS